MTTSDFSATADRANRTGTVVWKSALTGVPWAQCHRVSDHSVVRDCIPPIGNDGSELLTIQNLWRARLDSRYGSELTTSDWAVYGAGSKLRGQAPQEVRVRDTIYGVGTVDDRQNSGHIIID